MARQLDDLEPRRVDLDDRSDVGFWTDHYGCTEDRLRLAVKSVGPLAQNVREHIAKLAKEALK
jgi:hypothetical protein